MRSLSWQAQELITGIFTTRVLALLLVALMLWGSGGVLRSTTCRSAAERDGSGVPSGAPAQQLLAAGTPRLSDVPGSAGPPYILPAIIHQTVEDKAAMSCQVRESIQTWVDTNPGFRHVLYDAAERTAFVRQYYPELLPLYEALPTNVERADTWRYLALHKLGGVYADSDVKCMQPVATWNAEHGHDAALLVGIAKRNMRTGDTHEFNQFVMAAMPGHPVMASMPMLITSNFAASFLAGQRVSQTGHAHDVGVLSRTGPGAFTEALRRYAASVGGPWPINSTAADRAGGIRFGSARAMPKFVLGMGWDTIDHNMTCAQVKAAIRPEAYICHQFFGTWKKNPEVSIKLSYNNCAGNLTYAAGGSSSSTGGGSSSTGTATT